MNNKMKGLDAFTLKLIALIFMVIDHLHTYLFYAVWPGWISLLPRFVSPLFLYLLLEGFYHTHSRKKYAIRLFIAGILMWGGNIAINLYFHNVDIFTGRYTFSSLINGQNIFMTLAVLFMLFWCMDVVKNHNKTSVRVLALLAALGFAGISIFLEGGIYLLPLAIIFWLFYGNKKRQCLVTAAMCVVLLTFAVISYFTGESRTTLYGTLCFNAEWAMIFVIPFILAYNHQRGLNNKFTKYMFYIIYPAHLWPLMILSYIIG